MVMQRSVRVSELEVQKVECSSFSAADLDAFIGAWTAAPQVWRRGRR